MMRNLITIIVSSFGKQKKNQCCNQLSARWQSYELQQQKNKILIKSIWGSTMNNWRRNKVREWANKLDASPMSFNRNFTALCVCVCACMWMIWGTQCRNNLVLFFFHTQIAYQWYEQSHVKSMNGESNWLLASQPNAFIKLSEYNHQNHPQKMRNNQHIHQNTQSISWTANEVFKLKVVMRSLSFKKKTHKNVSQKFHLFLVGVSVYLSVCSYLCRKYFSWLQFFFFVFSNLLHHFPTHFHLLSYARLDTMNSK